MINKCKSTSFSLSDSKFPLWLNIAHTWPIIDLLILHIPYVVEVKQKAASFFSLMIDSLYAGNSVSAFHLPQFPHMHFIYPVQICTLL